MKREGITVTVPLPIIKIHAVVRNDPAVIDRKLAALENQPDTQENRDKRAFLLDCRKYC